jgi:hypothetical protein
MLCAKSIFSYISSSGQPLLEDSLVLIQLSLMCLLKGKLRHPFLCPRVLIHSVHSLMPLQFAL